MIIVKLMGGLGNQMYEYAFGKHIALKNNTDLKLDLRFLLDRSPKKFFVYRDFDLNIFNINYDLANNNDLNNNLSYYKEKYFHFDKEALNIADNSYIEGFWQSEKYFIDIKDVIRKEFSFKNEFNEESKKLSDEIQNCNAVCINVRRGYINNLKEKYYHGFLGLKYINKAKDLIKTKVENPHFFIFSDDMSWCEANIKDEQYPLTFVSHKYAGEKFQYYLQLMTQCKHFIIPNSSFGWWGAWLNQNPDKIVIAPKKWFRFALNNTKDLIPDNWIRI